MENSITPVRYFAAANSGRGFVSFFDGIFGGLDRLYVIKGGSGTGKSRMMEDIAASAEARGYRVERYYCSADALSLDGVIIPDLSAGMVDGTAPHTRDPKYPGAVDEIVNVGAFWDADLLRSRKSEIKHISDAKGEAFGRAFGALGAAYGINAIMRSVAAETLITEKLGKAAARLAREWPEGPGARLETRPLDAFTMRGPASFNTFAEQAGRLYLVTGKNGAAPAFLDAVIDAAAAAGQPVFRAPDTLDTDVTAELFLPAIGAAFVRDCGGREPYKTVNTDRFTDAAAVRDNRKKLASLSRLKKELTGCAGTFLSEAAALHFELEKIYSGAMDFYAKEKLTAELIEKILP